MPALRPDVDGVRQGITSTCPIRMVFDVSPFATLIFFTVVSNRVAMPLSVSPDLTL